MRLALLGPLLLAPALAWSAPTLPAGDMAAEHAQTCRHYDNRARFKPRTGAPDFTVILADGCAAALAEAGDPATAEPRRAAAAAFLDRLTAARGEIAAINRKRAAGPDNQLRVASAGERTPLDLGRALGLVTRTGEILILRAGGVFAALAAWRAAAAE